MKKLKEKIQVAKEFFQMWCWFWAAWSLLALLYCLTWEAMQPWSIS